MMAVTVDLQGVLTMCTHVGFGRDLAFVAYRSVKCHLIISAHVRETSSQQIMSLFFLLKT